MRQHGVMRPWMALVALSIALPAAEAQSPAPTQPSVLVSGSRIRVQPVAPSPLFPDGKRRVGTFRALTPDSLTIEWTEGGTSTMPRSAVIQLEASQGRRRFVGRGLLIGLVVGGGTGAFVGAADYDASPCGTSDCFLDFGRGFYAATGAAVGGAIGVLVGGTVGATARREVWRRIHLDAVTARVRVMPLPAARGVLVRWTASP